MAIEIAIVSGKGGTGKTTIAAAFTAISQNLVTADCDVDAPDLHILLQPETKKTEEFQSSKVALINQETCTECGLCVERCRFEAIDPPKVNAIACEGCGVCAYVCPEKAVEMTPRISGFLYESMTRFGPMSHAKLLPGEGNSGKLVTEVRKQAQELARKNDQDITLIDGSPGIGCPVIATVSNTKLGVIVTEPTMSGIHDMERVMTLLERFRVHTMVIVNKYDLNPENTERIEEICAENGVDFLGTIPFDSVMTESMVAAKTLPEFDPNHKITRLLKSMWGKIAELAASE
ncbi:MAG: nucleotide-binding protein [Candidatus Thorarchaeota archaeon]|jgi:MinD superfamily P-loop ATPase